MALRVFKRFNLLPYGFLFNIKGLSVKYFRFFLQLMVMPIRGEPNRSSQIVLRNIATTLSTQDCMDHCRVVLQNTVERRAINSGGTCSTGYGSRDAPQTDGSTEIVSS